MPEKRAKFRRRDVGGTRSSQNFNSLWKLAHAAREELITITIAMSQTARSAVARDVAETTFLAER